MTNKPVEINNDSVIAYWELQRVLNQIVDEYKIDKSYVDDLNDAIGVYADAELATHHTPCTIRGAIHSFVRGLKWFPL
jgi:cell division ATPase FtsA